MKSASVQPRELQREHYWSTLMTTAPQIPPRSDCTTKGRGQVGDRNLHLLHRERRHDCRTLLSTILRWDPAAKNNWASVSEPHTCDFNATFSLYVYIMLYIYIYICDRHCTSNIAINISIFHLGLIYTRRARAHTAPTRRGAERSAPPIVEATAHRGRAVNLRACALAV